MKTVRSKIIFLEMIVIIVISMTIFLLAIETYSQYSSLKITESLSVVTQESERINKDIRQLEEDVTGLALLGEIYYLSKSRSIDLGRYAAIRNFEHNSLAVGGGIWFEPFYINADQERFCFYAFNTGPGKAVIDEAFQSEAYDYPTQMWYTTIKAGEQGKGSAPVWTRPYYDDAGTTALMTTVGAGIYDRDGKFVGMATVDWALDDIVRNIRSIRPTPNSFTLFADLDNDFIVAQSDPNVSGESIGESLKTVPWFNQIALLPYRTITYNGQKYISFAKTLDNHMIIIVNIPKDELYSDINLIMKEMVLTLVLAGILISLITFYLLNRFINKPITYLTQKVSELGKGNLRLKIDMKSNDEFGRLANSFNKMTTDIQDHIKRLRSVTAEKERISTELDVAREIQSSLLPSIFPPYPDRKEFDIFAKMLPAQQVGGDFYDFYLIGEDRLAIVIADVSDKGVPAALFMVVTKTLIKDYAQLGLSIAEIFNRANAQLCENNDVGMFVTMFMGILDIKTGEFSYASAGHNPPFLRRSDGTFEPMDVDQDFILGGMKGILYHERKMKLSPGDTLFCYTDGITEAANHNHHLFGMERLTLTLAKAPEEVETVLDRVKEAVDVFVKKAPQSDDMTMLCLTFNGEKGRVEKDVEEKDFPAEINALPDVLSFITKTLESHSFPKEKRVQLEMAVEEFFINIAKYSYSEQTDPKMRTARIHIGFYNSPQRVFVRMTDQGVPYNPLNKMDPDVTLPAEAREIGGLGIFMAKKNLDHVGYEYADGQNILTLVKHL